MSMSRFRRKQSKTGEKTHASRTNQTPFKERLSELKQSSKQPLEARRWKPGGGAHMHTDWVRNISMVRGGEEERGTRRGDIVFKKKMVASGGGRAGIG